MAAIKHHIKIKRGNSQTVHLTYNEQTAITGALQQHVEREEKKHGKGHFLHATESRLLTQFRELLAS